MQHVVTATRFSWTPCDRCCHSQNTLPSIKSLGRPPVLGRKTELVWIQPWPFIRSTKAWPYRKLNHFAMLTFSFRCVYNDWGLVERFAELNCQALFNFPDFTSIEQAARPSSSCLGKYASQFSAPSLRPSRLLLHHIPFSSCCGLTVVSTPVPLLRASWPGEL